MKNYLNVAIVAISVIIGAWLLAGAYASRNHQSESISVTGAGEENFTSDLIVWRAGFSKKAMDLKDAYAALNADQKKIRSYLTSKGVKADELVFEAVDIQKDYYNDYDENGVLRNSVFNGYVLRQSLKVQSKSVELVEQLSREVTELIDAGIELNSYPPEYYYTKLAELKLQMIEKATQDAKKRAEQIAVNSGGQLGRLKQADMGVFQISGEYTTEEFTWGGNFNTSAKRKTANITVRLKYEID